MSLVFLLLVFSLIMLFVSMDKLGRLSLAKATLENLNRMHEQGIISTIQANVYLNEMRNPYDTRSILEVNHELREIYEKHQSSNR